MGFGSRVVPRNGSHDFSSANLSTRSLNTLRIFKDIVLGDLQKVEEALLDLLPEERRNEPGSTK
ncbi:hypothetical protein NMG60_11031372 [Bertholletia excelsa]